MSQMYFVISTRILSGSYMTLYDLLGDRYLNDVIFFCTISNK